MNNRIKDKIVVRIKKDAKNKIFDIFNKEKEQIKLKYYNDFLNYYNESKRENPSEIILSKYSNIIEFCNEEIDIKNREYSNHIVYLDSCLLFLDAIKYECDFQDTLEEYGKIEWHLETLYDFIINRARNGKDDIFNDNLLHKDSVIFGIKKILKLLDYQ